MASFPIGSGSSSSSSSSSSSVLDGVRGELVRAPSRLGKKREGGVSDTKAAMALKNHSEAERRRRERINSHLTTLRSMVPCTDKLDKAALLAEVINQVKELKNDAVETSKGCTIPSDIDEVRVEVESDMTISGNIIIKASLCCKNHPELFADLRHTLERLQLRTIRAEISTLGGRVKIVFITMCESNPADTDRHVDTTSLRQALKSILDRINSQVDFLPRASFSSKRRRNPLFESSNSSS